MSGKKTKPYSKKHDPNVSPDPMIEAEMKKRNAKHEISCALAFEIAKGLGVKPKEVGLSADVLNTTIVKCQLGLFGYKPENKIVTDDETSNQALNDAVTGSSENQKLSCEKAWQIAGQFNVSKLSVGNTCQSNGIKIKNCCLGAF